MSLTVRSIDTFPSARIPSESGGLPIEVTLIAQLGIGAGDRLISDANTRQRAHEAYVDALDEPSARIGRMDLAHSDPSSLYTFSVGRGGHPFHRHAGLRSFTAIAGSAGALLRFSTASQPQIDDDPESFVRALRQVRVPPDCLFTVRFGGGTWHQFLPGASEGHHAALFALSCHPDERGGELPEALQSQVAANAASIPTLTEVLSPAVRTLIEAQDPSEIPTISLALRAAPHSLAASICVRVRRVMGRWHALVVRQRKEPGFWTRWDPRRELRVEAVPWDSILREQFVDGFEHEDAVQVTTEPLPTCHADASTALAAVLEGFLSNPPKGVTRLMALRNVLVRPLGLRTSPLGCPVSSLLSAGTEPSIFAGFSVLAHRASQNGRAHEVLLGADDRHLRFRSCVRVEKYADGRFAVLLGTRVKTLNLFGRAYIAAINRVHRRYIAPTMTLQAVDHAIEHQMERSATADSKTEGPFSVVVASGEACRS